jgi:hypothetical protein
MGKSLDKTEDNLEILRSSRPDLILGGFIQPGKVSETMKLVLYWGTGLISLSPIPFLQNFYVASANLNGRISEEVPMASIIAKLMNIALAGVNGYRINVKVQ